MIFIDRSRTVKDWQCRRERYWRYMWNRVGLTSAGMRPLPLSFGSLVHDTLNGLAEGHSWTDAWDSAYAITPLHEHLPQSYVLEEYLALGQAMTYGFAISMWQQMMADFEVVTSEFEASLVLGHHPTLGEIILVAKPDLIVRRKSDKTLWYWEYKTTGDISDSWFEQWPRAIQLMAGARAVGQTLGEPIAGAVVQALYKGYKKFDKPTKKSHLYSPLVRGSRDKTVLGGAWPFVYRSIPGSAPVYSYEIDPARDLKTNVTDWIDHMPMDMLLAQFPQTPPVLPDDKLIDNWLEQLMFREVEIAEALADNQPTPTTLNKVFPQSFSNCHTCAYEGLCFNAVAANDPLQHGYTLREPHHPLDPAHHYRSVLLEG